jgi:hypothetical protein
VPGRRLRARSPLLIFRVLYFMLPFCAAVLLLSAREGWLASKIAADKARTAATKSAIVLKPEQRPFAA